MLVVYCWVTLENLGSVPLSYDQGCFSLETPDWAWPGGARGLVASVGSPLLSGVLRPGESVRGTVAFQVTKAGAAAIREVLYMSRPSPSTLAIHWAESTPTFNTTATWCKGVSSDEHDRADVATPKLGRTVRLAGVTEPCAA